MRKLIIKSKRINLYVHYENRKYDHKVLPLNNKVEKTGSVENKYRRKAINKSILLKN